MMDKFETYEVEQAKNYGGGNGKNRNLYKE